MAAVRVNSSVSRCGRPQAPAPLLLGRLAPCCCSTGPRMAAAAPRAHRKSPNSGPLAASSTSDASAASTSTSTESRSWEQLVQEEEVALRGMAASSRGMPVVAAMSTARAPVDLPASKPAGKSKWTIDESENLRSTPEQRLWTYGSMAIMAATFSQALLQADSAADWGGIAVSMMAAYVLSDLGTGIYHWSVDNYGDGQTPLVGRQIAAFQGHHQRPWTITKREFANNLHQVFKPAAFPAGLFLLLSPWTPAAFDSFMSLFIFLVCMSQQFHAWGHMKKSELPGIVLQLQDAGVLISRKAHGAHHRAPFEGNYCIVSGLWNEPLDNSGFFRGLEKVVVAVTGVEPRCWSEPEYEIEEETASSSASM